MSQPTCERQSISCWTLRKGNNAVVELNSEQTEQIEDLLTQLEELDPAELPVPAVELAALLGEILEGTDGS